MIAFRLRVSWKEDFIFHGSYRFSFAAVHLPYVKGTVIKELISYIIKAFKTILFTNYIYENSFIKQKKFSHTKVHSLSIQCSMYTIRFK